ncbi:MAG TPA: 1-acyl-sn-glycerol-3-phosphate acyltransferase [Cyclobacteriaceae bacterium]
MKRTFYLFMFRLFGWKVLGHLPKEKKFVLIVAPHTSYADFFVGVAARSILKLKSYFLAKDDFFKMPFVGWFLKILGGYPVNRSRHTRMVDAIVEIFDSHQEFVMTVTPEGTRKYNPKWKTGFYYIALNAKVPIVMVGFDYKRKIVEMKDPYYPTGAIERDFKVFKDYFKTIAGRFPEYGVK